MRRASTVCAISSRKKQKVPRPSALARYSAMSAFFSSVSALMSGNVSAIPTLAPISTR